MTVRMANALDPAAASLLELFGAPCFVADSEGRIVYANPAFTAAFASEQASGSLEGLELEAVFEGGAREAVLQAVAAVFHSDDVASFRLRERSRAYSGLASPIREGCDCVGVAVMLGDELLTDTRALGLHAEIEEPLAESIACLEELIEQTGGRREERHRAAVERGLSALVRARKRCDELRVLLSGARRDSAPSEACDVVAVLRQVRNRLDPDFAGAGVRLDLLVPAALPPAQGDATHLESALVHLLRHRLAETGGGHSFLVTARVSATAHGHALLVSVVDLPGEGRTPTVRTAATEPRPVREAIDTLGGLLYTLVDPDLGRVTVLRLPTG